MSMQHSAPFTEKIREQRGGGIRFIQAEEDGDICWFYVRISDEQLHNYKAALANGEDMDIRDYGQILESGWGDYPPLSMVAFIEERYGYITPAS